MSRICTINRSRYLATSPRRPIAKRSTKVVRYIITEAPVPPEASEEPKLQDGNQHSVKQARQQEPSQTLPLSPLMDPAMIEAREKWKKPKPVASKQKTKLQRQLEVNPYANALLTPVRKCNILEVRLPSFFLQDFDVKYHPETQNPWLLPMDILKEPRAKVPTKQKGDSATDDMNLAPQAPHLPPLPVGRALASQRLLRKVHLKSYWERIVSGNHRRRTNVPKDIVWREGMDDLVLQLLRRRALWEIKRVVRGWRDSYCLSSGDIDVILAENPGKVVLYLGDVQGSHEKESGVQKEQPDLNNTKGTLSGIQSSALVFDIPQLLGSHYVASIRTMLGGINRDHNSKALILDTTFQALAAQMWLWKIECYIIT